VFDTQRERERERERRENTQIITLQFVAGERVKVWNYQVSAGDLLQECKLKPERVERVNQLTSLC
jgi:hypothetical protein